MTDTGTLVVGSFHDIRQILGSKVPGVTYFDKVDHEKTFPANVTLGFRGTFWKIFSDLYEIFSGEHKFTWLDSEWTLRRAFILRSVKPDVQLYLEDRAHVFVALHIVSADGKDGEWINAQAFERGLTEQQLLHSLYQAVGDANNLAQVKTATHRRNLPARFLFPVEDAEMNATAVSLLCFYTLAQLIVWQIDRDHASIELRPDPNDINRKLIAVLRNRARIINVRRYFLTKNITNDKANARITALGRSHINLKAKFDGFIETNDLIEKFFLASSQIRQNRSTKILNITALFIAIIGLPTAVMSMLIALQDNTLIVKNPSTIINQAEYVYFLVISLLISITAVMAIWLLVRYVINRGN